MEEERTQELPIQSSEEAGPGGSPEDTSSIPVVESCAGPGAPQQLHRAANALSLGQAAEAAARCREVIAQDPACAEAYAVLALAEEQLGNPHVAVELYEELLRLDPTRTTEAERLAELRSTLAEIEAEQPTPQEREERLRRLQPVALAMLIGAAALLLISVTLLLVVKQRRAEANRQYQTLVAGGQAYYQTGQYPEALALFSQALQARPEDETTRQWWEAAQYQARLAAARSQPSTPLLPWSQSPFDPVPIGPQPGMPTDPGPPAFPPPVMPGTPALIRPPSVTGSPQADWGPAPTTPPATLPPPIPGPPSERTGPQPIEPPRATEPPAPEPVAPAAQAPPSPPPEPAGQITITVSERRASAPAAPSASARERADGLRAQANRLYEQQSYGEAARTYRQALGAYQEARAAHPELRQVLDSAIASVQARIGLCERQQP